MKPILLNADMGESFGPWVMGLDHQVMPHVDLANIACGFHASDPDVMRRTVRMAAEHSVGIGAHPAYPDLIGFGRRSLACSPTEIENLVLYQIGALAAICRAEGIGIRYVKPHGALYNDMAHRPEIFSAVARAMQAYDPEIPLMTLATRDTSAIRELALEHDITLWFEAFADRAYDGDGRLVSRTELGAVHHDPDVIIEQARRIASGHPLTASDGTDLILTVDTLCVHGDNEESVASVRAIRQMLNRLHRPA
ncbi:5-oxoprolinase subunit PxpA [Marinobacter orientalis]|uniref:5-oxoprolinase subunit A n=1 Tax=Marinobacter orientalis TaxID=1928859 RepID=A0A7Y0RDX3_9GAMM|nr:5-oxoprolinase subunit PxpA [Marinobacter orientalis]NMT64453.1 5-oxoprolinase subunit PxpA [Marinobacter orientalis]TGX50587.1 5-oxoprolinase subunit PxpA [Marinobacter orientalis]